METGERKPEAGERKLDSNVKGPWSRGGGIAASREDVRAGNTNLRIQYRLAIVNLESGRRLRFSSASTTNEHESARISTNQRTEVREQRSAVRGHKIPDRGLIEFVKSM